MFELPAALQPQSANPPISDLSQKQRRLVVWSGYGPRLLLRDSAAERSKAGRLTYVGKPSKLCFRHNTTARFLSQCGPVLALVLCAHRTIFDALPPGNTPISGTQNGEALRMGTGPMSGAAKLKLGTGPSRARNSPSIPRSPTSVILPTDFAHPLISAGNTPVGDRPRGALGTDPGKD
jgi:hypothetical protein